MKPKKWLEKVMGALSLLINSQELLLVAMLFRNMFRMNKHK